MKKSILIILLTCTISSLAIIDLEKERQLKRLEELKRDFEYASALESIGAPWLSGPKRAELRKKAISAYVSELKDYLTKRFGE